MTENRPEERTPLSRRSFMGGAAALGVGAMIAPALRAGTGAGETIHVGFIGAGGRGAHLMEETLKLAADGAPVKVAAVCDIYDIRAKDAQARAKLEDKSVYRDYRRLLEQPGLDAVVVATPDHWHHDMTMAALKAGKDVYCEKPFTQTYEQARDLAEEAEKLKRVIQVGVNSCSNSLWLDAYKLIEEGRIGKVLLTTSHHSRNSKKGEWNYEIDTRADPKKNLDWEAFLGSAPKTSWEPERFFRWRKFWDYSGGIATDLFFHQLTHLLVALDGPSPTFPRRVSALGGIYQFWDREVPDTFAMTIDYPSNHTVFIMASMANDFGVPEAIRGHEGTIIFKGDALELQYQGTIVGDKDPVTIQSTRPGNAYEHLKNFFECMRSRKEPSCPASLAYRVQVAIDMAVRSYREGQTAYWHRRRETIEMCSSR